MNIEEKRAAIDHLNRLISSKERKIQSKQAEIDILQKQLKELQNTHDIIAKSEFKIAMFKVNITPVLADEEEDIEYIYVMLDVDTGNVYEKKAKGKNRDIIPDGGEDYLECFEKYNMPKHMFNGKTPLNTYEISLIVLLAISDFKTKVNQIIKDEKCETWEEVKLAMDHELYTKDALTFHIIPNETLYFGNKSQK